MSDDTRIRVRRKREPLFAYVPTALARDSSLSDKAHRLWIILESFADWDDGSSYPTIKTLASLCGECSRATIGRAQKELVERELLEIESGKSAGRPNVYVLLDPPASVQGVLHSCATPSLTDALPGAAPVHEGGSSPARYKQQSDKQESLNERTSREAAFDEIWKLYPRKLNRKGALDKFIARCREGVSIDDLRRATENYALSMVGKDQMFILHGATFFGRNRRYEDYLDGPIEEGAPVEPAPRPRRDGDSRSLPELLQTAAANEERGR